VHVAVPHTTVALFDLRGRVLVERRLKHGPTEPAYVLARAADGLAELLTATDRVPLGIGVATGGWVDRDSGTIVEHALLGWREVAVREVLGARTGLPVHVDGHARALVNAERLFGRAGDGRSVLHLFVGHVVDAAFATNDEVHHGPRSQAGAIAHLPLAGGTEACDCGRTGCLQAELSEGTLVRRAREAGVIDTVNPMHVVRAADGGDATAVRLLLERARLTGRAAGLLLDVLNPDTVVRPSRSPTRSRTGSGTAAPTGSTSCPPSCHLGLSCSSTRSCRSCAPAGCSAQSTTATRGRPCGSATDSRVPQTSTPPRQSPPPHSLPAERTHRARDRDP